MTSKVASVRRASNSVAAIALLVFGAMAAAALSSGAIAQTAEPKGKVCRMEQQCHWENFKKICTYVKVCR
jgi:hypothetical protein